MSEGDDGADDADGPEEIADHVRRVRELLHDSNNEDAAADD